MPAVTGVVPMRVAADDDATPTGAMPVVVPKETVRADEPTLTAPVPVVVVVVVATDDPAA